MRILIVGAGMAGMTLAALLEQRGQRPTLIERAPSTEHAGYMLGLYPLGGRVLHGLGLHEKLVERSVAVSAYEARGDAGELIKRFSLAPLGARFGPLLSTTRPDLVELLRSGLGDVDLRFGTTITALEPSGEEVHATFSDGSTGTFDLVVGADGMHSKVRELVFGQVPSYDTKWGGWVWWAPSETIGPELFVEYWGAGRLLGAYPTGRGAGIFAGAPVADGFEQPEGRAERLQRRFAGLGPQVDTFLSALPDDSEPLFFWRLMDVRSDAWTKGRVVLLGDAAVGFLPTAGVGASMALESAAVLADELSRTDSRFVEHALSLYVKRRRKRVEAIQDESRTLAKLMFVSSGAVAAIRNFATRFATLEMFMSSIVEAFDDPI